MSHPTSSNPTPVLVACVEQLERALKAAGEADPAYLQTVVKADLLVRLTTASSQLEAFKLRVGAASDDVAVDHGARTVADWVAHHTRTDRRVAHAQHKLADALAVRWGRVATGLTDGAVHLEQARVIVKALEALPDDIPDHIKALAEERLVAHAAQFPPADLTRLGRRILDVVAPEVGDEHDRHAIEQMEAKAASVTRLDFKRRGDGATDITATVPDAVAARLKIYLEAFTSPRQPRQPRPGDPADPATGVRLPADRQRGEAFCALLERIDPDRLPDHGSLATTVVITMSLETLTTGLGTAQLLGTDTQLSAGQARRLACTAGLVPAVLGTRSEVLDLGRTARLYRPPQRLALGVQHPHCRAEGCTVPAPWCEAHHDDPWSLGGKTDLRDGSLLCAFHHHRTHDPAYRVERLPNGDYRYHRRV